MDGTLEMIRDFQARHDREGKVVFITAEDLGNPDGFWPEKDVMCRAFAERTTGEWLWEVDYDEFYLEADMKSVFELLGADPSISAVSFPFRQFWGGSTTLRPGSGSCTSSEDVTVSFAGALDTRTRATVRRRSSTRKAATFAASTGSPNEI